MNSPSYPRRRFYSRVPQRASIRIGFYAVITIVAISSSHFRELRSSVVLARPTGKASDNLNLSVRDSLTGYAVRSRLTSRLKNGAATPLSTSAIGRGTYQLAMGPHDLEIAAAGYKSLSTHFTLDPDSTLNVTVWVDSEEPPYELRPEVINSKILSGYALLHGHILKSTTGQPIKDVRVHLEQAGVESQTDDRGYFLFYAPVQPINPTEELPNTDNLIADLDGYQIYRLDNILLAEGATHFIIDMTRGKGIKERDDTHKLLLSPEKLKNTQTEIPEVNNKKLAPNSLGTREGIVQPLALTVPTSIRVGSNCSCKACCTTVNVYSLDTYVKNGLDDEWISSWNANSLKAGAIAYRSYGVYYVYHPASSNYDICNTTSCQVNDPTDSATSTNSATDATAGMLVVDSSGNNPFFAEYAAENNDSSCADGFTGSPGANWSCMSDSVDAGQAFNGHGRGMCQWGTQRWAVNQGKDYVWILNHYYNNNGNPSGARSALLQSSSSAPTSVLSPVVGPLRVTSSNLGIADGKWEFDQHKTGFHRPGGGINGSDDTYAWDANLGNNIVDSPIRRPA